MIGGARRARVDIRPTLRLFGADPTRGVPPGRADRRGRGGRGDARRSCSPRARSPDDALLVELEAAAGADGGFAVVGVGDVLTPRTIEEAVLDGLRAAVAI